MRKKQKSCANVKEHSQLRQPYSVLDATQRRALKK